MAAEALTSGVYTPRHDVTVTVWPAPDPNGDGPEVLDTQYDNEGNHLGQEVRRDDKTGEIVHHYNPPDGFIHIPTRETGADGEPDVYVRGDSRGRIVRNTNGHAIGIKPGTALLEHSDGTHELLATQYAQLQFVRSHDKNGEGE